MITANQNPEQHVRDEIDRTLIASGWQVQSKSQSPFAVFYDVFEIETKITKEGSKITIGEYIDRREMLTVKSCGTSWMKMLKAVVVSAKKFVSHE